MPLQLIMAFCIVSFNSWEKLDMDRFSSFTLKELNETWSPLIEPITFKLVSMPYMSQIVKTNVYSLPSINPTEPV